MPYISRIVSTLGRGWPLGVLLVLSCLLLGADVSVGQQRDICGCASHPDATRDFDLTDQTTWPQGTTRVDHGGGAATVTVPLPPDGVLVFQNFLGKYFQPPSCCTNTVFVRFTRSAANTPVTILVKGDFQIDPGVQLFVIGDNGTGGSTGINGLGGLGGPGGFRGGDGAYQFINLAADGGAGFGPGGGAPGTGLPSLTGGGDGAFVGIPELLPLVGGAGGGGGGSSTSDPGCSAGGGGGGGGALLIASNGTITVNGTISADGGNRSGPANGSCSTFGGAGSGGAIRLVADNITGSASTGLIAARGGFFDCCNRVNKKGAIRLEAFTNSLPGDRTDPPAFRALAPGPLVSPITPTVTIKTINGQTVPTPPQGVFGQTDLILNAPGLVPIDIETSAVPGGTTVQVTVKPRVGGAPVSQDVLLGAPLGACDSSGKCTTSATFDLPPGEFLIEARATFQTP